MDLKLIRKYFIKESTGVELYVNGEFETFVLEDKDRGLKQTDDLQKIKDLKVYGKTCIPYGRYEVVITYSPKFKRDMPRLLNVPGFEGVLIHGGNTVADTYGCLLVGELFVNGMDKEMYIKGGTSRPAFEQLFTKLQTALKTEKVFVEIV